MLQTKNTLLGKAKIFILVFFIYYLLMINSLGENQKKTENVCLKHSDRSLIISDRSLIISDYFVSLLLYSQASQSGVSRRVPALLLLKRRNKAGSFASQCNAFLSKGGNVSRLCTFLLWERYLRNQMLPPPQCPNSRAISGKYLPINIEYGPACRRKENILYNNS